MLQCANDIMGYQLKARDGEIGRSKDLLFDDKSWTIRYLVVDTGGWLMGRRIIISPFAVQSLDSDTKMLAVNLTKNQIENSPSLDEDKPVSRQYEVEIFGYYNWPIYASENPWGLMGAPGDLPVPETEDEGDKHLRSMNEVEGYSVQAEDGSIGHIHGLIIDEDSWGIKHIVVDTRKWLSGKKVIIDSSNVTSIDWVTSEVKVSLLRKQIEKSPEYDPSTPLGEA
ncbi:MAG: PRC-barrel domain-containing protein [Candidatus Marinimicrobia bacterium]|nr:PRC-barrel domain-containing protein [Candidatus Neomarinimicrobiota bacterium]